MPTTTRRKPTQSRSQETQRRILEAATTILQKQGRKDLTTRKLAAESGLSIGSIYEYYPNIQAIIQVLYKERTKKGMALIESVFRDPDPKKSLRQLFMEYDEQATKQKLYNRAYLELWEASEQDPKLRRLNKKAEDDLTLIYVNLFELRGSPLSREKLTMISQYMHGLDRINMQLQYKKSKTEREFFNFLTSKSFEALAMITGCSLD